MHLVCVNNKYTLLVTICNTEEDEEVRDLKDDEILSEMFLQDFSQPASSLSILRLQQYLWVRTTRRKTVPMDPTPPQNPRTPPRIALNSSDSGQSCSASTETPLAEFSGILSVLRCILTVLVADTSVTVIIRRRVVASLMVSVCFDQTVDNIMADSRMKDEGNSSS